MRNSPAPSQNGPTLPKHWLFWFLASALIVALGITIYLIYSTVRDEFYIPGSDEMIVAPVEENQESQIDQSVFQELSTPLQHRNGPPGQSWDEKSQINVLILGVDDRVDELDDGPPRTDTMILATINPENKTAGMLSLPRDLWVDVPGYGYYKINQAYFLGESQAISGGGAGLAMDTVDEFLDVQIPYYVQINFNTFIQLIDEMGGVKIDVPERIMVNIGKGNVKTLQPGVQTLPGDIALAYVRARNTADGDFDRTRRQQQVLFGIFQRLTDFNLIPTLINKAPSLYKNVASGVNTNLTLSQIAKLAQLAYGIPNENIQHLVIGHDQVVEGFSYNGMYILSPIPEQIEALKNELFNMAPVVTNPTPRPSSTPVTTLPAPTETREPSFVEEILSTDEAQPTTPPPQEGPSIAVHNGTGTSGLAGDTAEYLKANGVRVTEIGNAGESYTYTTIIDYTGNPDTITQLSQLLGLSDIKIYNRYDPDSEVDLLLTLGNDWAESNTLP
ncbi:MAG: LCP family protein [Anaerolineales bacterium]|nr:LCP family protein [Anaerolineales bacterium]